MSEILTQNIKECDKCFSFYEAYNECVWNNLLQFWKLRNVLYTFKSKYVGAKMNERVFGFDRNLMKVHHNTVWS